MQLSRHRHIQLVAGPVGNQIRVTELALRLDIGQHHGTRQNQHRDNDAQTCRTAVELQRIVEHLGVSTHDRVLESSHQETSPADLDFGGKPQTRHVSLGNAGGAGRTGVVASRAGGLVAEDAGLGAFGCGGNPMTHLSSSPSTHFRLQRRW